MKTALNLELRRERSERMIEDLLYDYPYLIDPRLERGIRQVHLSAESRADLIFRVGPLTIIVEIKVGAVGVATVRQIERYVRELGLKPESVEGILVGRSLGPGARRLMQNANVPIAFRELDLDVPTQIVVCRRCRTARSARIPFCPIDKESRVLADLGA